MSDSIRVLYVEDNWADADLTRQEFARLGSEFEVEFVDTARACRRRLEQRVFDVLLLDHHLPDEDGSDLLGDLSRSGLKQPVVMITGVGDEELVIRTLKLGASDYLPKSGDYISKLPAVVRRVVTEHRALQARGLSLAPRRRHILYVEHHQADIDLTLESLARSTPHLDVRIAGSFGEALQVLTTSRDIELVVTDLRMPPTNALDFLREVHLAGIRLPFIIITGKGDEETAVAAVKLGAFDYIVKRDNYLTYLPLAIENALARFQLRQANDSLQADLLEANRTLEQKVKVRTAELQHEIAERAKADAERLDLQRQLFQAQKLDGLGRLAGGVAHDFNNLLIVIRGYTELALQGLPETSRSREHLRTVDAAAARAADLTKRLLAFARKQVIEPKVFDINYLLANMEQMLRRLVGGELDFVVQPGRDLWPVKADAGLIEQVVVNLCVNARDAMPNGGQICLATSNERLDPGRAVEQLGVAPGDYVALAVSDSGTGLSDEARLHVFEPFFTTKPEGRGTGLGLATCLGIIRQAGGYIEFESERGRGTTFKAFIPRVDDGVPLFEVDRAEAPQPGHETILLAEDEPLVREYAAQALTTYGYSVLEARDGPEALQIAARHNGRIDLLLTDVAMPAMSGTALAEQMRAIWPSTKVVFVSGYTDQALTGELLVSFNGHFLQKPYTSASLTRKVREALDSH